jgi:hypothetical protein
MSSLSAASSGVYPPGIDALGRASVSAIQTTAEELREELERPIDARS